MDWSNLFGVEKSFLEIFLRGTCMYFGLLLLSRFFLRRQSGSGGVSDMLVIVLLADAAQNAMSGEYKTITEGMLLVSTILSWTFVVDALGYKIKFFERLTNPSPLLMVKDGQVLRKNMRKELITMDELMGEVRAAGIADLKYVKEARMEGNGKITVLKKEG